MAKATNGLEVPTFSNPIKAGFHLFAPPFLASLSFLNLKVERGETSNNQAVFNLDMFIGFKKIDSHITSKKC